MRNRYYRLLALLLSASLFIPVFMTGCQKKEAENTEETPEEKSKLSVTVTTPVRGDIDVKTEFSGSLEYADETEVFPKLSGEVTETHFEEGDHVNAGDLLFTLDDETYQMTLRTAQATYDTTQATTDQQLGALKMNRDSAEETVKKAEDGIGQAQNTYSWYQKQYSDLDDNRDDLEEDKRDMKEDKKSAKRKYKKAKSALKDAKESAEAAEAKYQEARAKGSSDEELTLLKTAADQAQAAVSAAQTNVNTLKSTLSSLESGIDQLDKSIDQLDSSGDTLDYQMANLNYTYEQAIRGTALAKESLDYFDLVTLPDTIKTADASLRQAQVGIDSAKLQLEYTKVKAPVSGTIKKKSVDEFDMVQAGMTAYVITNDDTVLATFNVPESVYRVMSVGQKVLVDRNGSEYTGTVTEVSENVDSATGLFKIKASVDGVQDELSPGTAVKITAVTNRAQDVVTIPVDCVYYSGGEAYTYAVENGVVRKVFVTPGLYDDDNIEIAEGLTEGMQIVTVWSSDLRDGLEVNVEGGSAEGGLYEHTGKSEIARAGDGAVAESASKGETLRFADTDHLPAAGFGVMEISLISGAEEGETDRALAVASAEPVTDGFMENAQPDDTTENVAEPEIGGGEENSAESRRVGGEENSALSETGAKAEDSAKADPGEKAADVIVSDIEPMEEIEASAEGNTFDAAYTEGADR